MDYNYIILTLLTSWYVLCSVKQNPTIPWKSDRLKNAAKFPISRLNNNDDDAPSFSS